MPDSSLEYFDDAASFGGGLEIFSIFKGNWVEFRSVGDLLPA